MSKDIVILFVFFKQKAAYEMRISDWSSDVCSSDLNRVVGGQIHILGGGFHQPILYERLDTTSRNILFARNQGEDHGIDLVGIEIQRPKVEYISIADYV